MDYKGACKYLILMPMSQTMCKQVFFIVCLIGFYMTPTKYRSYLMTFQLYWWRKISGALLCIISGTEGHLNITTDVPLASWIASSHERTESP
jgi:hypothetical protein